MSVPFSVPFPPSLPPLGNEMPITALSAISQTPSYPRDYFLLALCPGPCICIPKSPSLSYLFPCWLPIASISNLCSSLGLHLPQWKPTFAPSLYLRDLSLFWGLFSLLVLMLMALKLTPIWSHLTLIALPHQEQIMFLHSFPGQVAGLLLQSPLTQKNKGKTGYTEKCGSALRKPKAKFVFGRSKIPQKVLFGELLYRD